MAQITGNIVQANGTPISGAIITVTASQHSSVIGGDIFKGTSFDVVCGADGGYSFPLAVGPYSIQVKTGRTTVSLDGVVIDNNTPNGIDILGLVAYEGVSVTLAQQILNDATALSNAQATAVMSAVRANDGVGSGLDADLFQGQTLAQVISQAYNESAAELASLQAWQNNFPSNAVFMAGSGLQGYVIKRVGVVQINSSSAYFNTGIDIGNLFTGFSLKINMLYEKNDGDSQNKGMGGYASGYIGREEIATNVYGDPDLKCKVDADGFIWVANITPPASNQAYLAYNIEYIKQ